MLLADALDAWNGPLEALRRIHERHIEHFISGQIAHRFRLVLIGSDFDLREIFELLPGDFEPFRIMLKRDNLLQTRFDQGEGGDSWSDFESGFSSSTLDFSNEESIVFEAEGVSFFGVELEHGEGFHANLVGQ